MTIFPAFPTSVTSDIDSPRHHVNRSLFSTYQLKSTKWVRLFQERKRFVDTRSDATRKRVKEISGQQMVVFVSIFGSITQWPPALCNTLC